MPLHLRERLRRQPYRLQRRRLLTAALGDGPLQDSFAADRTLPSGYGVGFDERAVELPWALSRLHGHTLDAGSALNHPRVIERVLSRVTDLTVVTAAPERRAFTRLGVSYLYADLRDLPFRDGLFDTIACISTIEHIGMDNSGYGGPGRESDPAVSAAAATAELRRVLAPGGTLLVTVPFGATEDHGWVRQFGLRELEALERELGDNTETTVFGYTLAGWQRTTRDAVAAVRYRDPAVRRLELVPDLAVAARAVACLEHRAA